MKKTIIALSLCCSFNGIVNAQLPITNSEPRHYYMLGEEMFSTKNYLGSIQFLNQFIQHSNDQQLIAEAEFMILTSEFYEGNYDLENTFKEYLEKYPSSIHRNQINFMIAGSYFSKNDWKLANYWFEQVDVNQIPDELRVDYLYQVGLSSLKERDYVTARNAFLELSRSRNKYNDDASYYLAYLDFQEGKYNKALAVFDALRGKPRFSENANFFIIQGNFLQDKYGEVIKEGKNYLNKYPHTSYKGEISRMLGASYFQLGDYGNALTEYEIYVASGAPVIRENYYQFGELLYNRGSYDRSISALTEAATGNDALTQASNMLLGQAYLKEGNKQKALMYFDAAARSEANPNISEQALYNYVLLSNENVDVFGQSITAFKTFLAKYPNSKYKAEINKNLANILLQTKDYDLALKTIEGLSYNDQSDYYIQYAKQTILYQQGIQLFLNNNFDAAIKKFTASAQLGDYNTTVRNDDYQWLGESYYRIKDYNAAARNYETYFRLEKNKYEQNYATALYNYAYTLFQQEKYPQALDKFIAYKNLAMDSSSNYYKTTVSANRDDSRIADAWNRIGDCYLYDRQFAKAENAYQMAATQNPEQGDYALFQYAFVKGLQKDYNNKIVILNDMIAKYPSSPYHANALFEKSRAYVMLKNEPAAINTLEELLKTYPISPLSAKAGIQIGQLYLNNNQSQNSINAYKKVIENYPNSEESMIAINSMEGIYQDLNDISSYANYVNSLGGKQVVTASRQDTLTFQAAENIFMKGRKDESKSAFQNYLKAYPQGRFASNAHFYLGNMSFDAGNKDDAYIHFTEVINANNVKLTDDALIFVSGIDFDRKNYAQAYQRYKQLYQTSSNSKNKEVAQLGMLRTAFLLGNNQDVITSASSMIPKNGNNNSETIKEARFYRGKAYFAEGKYKNAIADLSIVGKKTTSTEGAEARFLVADAQYHLNEYNNVITTVEQFLKEGTPHKYWMARAVILLSDALTAKGDRTQAQQYLEGLSANYTDKSDEIHSMINERLASKN